LIPTLDWIVDTTSDSAAKPIWWKMHYQKGHQNTLAENKNRLYAILKRWFLNTFSQFPKMGGFAAESTSVISPLFWSHGEEAKRIVQIWLRNA